MNAPVAELITIGDEILYGQILDTNSQWMCQKLGELGIKVKYRTTIGDNREDILEAFSRAVGRSGLILVTGGLGPTSDDLTKPLLAEFYKSELKLHDEALEDVTRFFRERGREMTTLNIKQAELPDKCTFLSNKMGTAPGMWFQEGGVVLVSMPGVPREMKYLMEKEVIPRCRKLFSLPVIHHRMIRTSGIGESWLAEKIADWEKALPNQVKLAYLPTLSQVKLRLTTMASSLEEAKRLSSESEKQLLPIIEKYVYGYDDETLESAVGKMLKERSMDIAFAESCTGGYLSHMLTSVPGSSAYFPGAVVTYSNESKMRELGVKDQTLMSYGAVSEETVKEMAEGVRQKFGTRVAVSVSGIAGPDGGTDEKPVGTVWLACSIEGNIRTAKLQLGNRDRMTNIQLAAIAALNLARLHLNDIRD